jgi:hypothetical protein
MADDHNTSIDTSRGGDASQCLEDMAFAAARSMALCMEESFPGDFAEDADILFAIADDRRPSLTVRTHIALAEVSRKYNRAALGGKWPDEVTSFVEASSLSVRDGLPVCPKPSCGCAVPTAGEQALTAYLDAVDYLGL